VLLPLRPLLPAPLPLPPLLLRLLLPAVWL
jgi:hypothetical protein